MPPAAATRSRPASTGVGRAPRGVLSVVDGIPAALVHALALTTVVGVAAAGVGWRPFDSAWTCRGLVLIVLVASVLLVRVSRVGPAVLRSWPAFLPAGVLVLYALGARLLPLGERAEWFIGGDHVRHLHYVVQLQGQGALSYDVQPYPRAWHALLDTVWTAGGGQADAGGFRSLLDLMSTATWLLPAVLALATASTALRLAGRLGIDMRTATAAALVGGAGVLLPPFLTYYQSYGFENSYVAAIVAAVCVRAVLEDDDGPAPMFLTAAGVVVMAHTWQLLMPLPLLALAVTSARLLRRDRQPGRVAGAGGLWLVTAAVSWPAFRAVFVQVGVTHAAVSGVFPPVPIGPLVLVVAAVAVVVVLARRDRRVPLASLLVLLPGLTGAALSVRLGVPLTDYYPGKLVWHTAAMGLAVVPVVVALGLRRAATREALRRPVAGAVALVTGLLLLLALATPFGAFTGQWSTADGPAVVAGVTAPGGQDADVVWLGSVGTDTMTRILLDFYRARSSPAWRNQGPLDVAEECAILADSSRPTVLSDRPEAEVRARYSCSPDLAVVPVTVP